MKRGSPDGMTSPDFGSFHSLGASSRLVSVVRPTGVGDSGAPCEHW
jgi:hypothetical protein